MADSTTAIKRKRLAFVISVEVPAHYDAASVLDDLLIGIDALSVTDESYRYMAQPKGHPRRRENGRSATP